MNDILLTKYVAAAAILVTSWIGVMFPYLAAQVWDEHVLHHAWFRVLRAFAVGLVCGVAFMHVLVDAQSRLALVGDYPIANAVTLGAALLMVIINEAVTQTMSREQKASSREITPRDGSESSHVNRHPLLHPDYAGERTLLKYRLKAYTMEVSVGVHSVLVGVGLGVVTSCKAKVVTLALALLVHQLFEGIALGVVGAKANMGSHAKFVFVGVFTISCPLGALVGTHVANSYDEDNLESALALGLANALAGGALIYTGFVEMLNEEFNTGCGSYASKLTDGNEELKPLVNVEGGRDALLPIRLLALYLGGSVMAILAYWA